LYRHIFHDLKNQNVVHLIEKSTNFNVEKYIKLEVNNCTGFGAKWKCGSASNFKHILVNNAFAGVEGKVHITELTANIILANAYRINRVMAQTYVNKRQRSNVIVVPQNGLCKASVFDIYNSIY
jgi:hypothetical protein